MEGDQGRHVEFGQHVAVEDQEGLVDPGLKGGEADGASRVERGILDRVGEDDAGAPAIWIGVDEGVWSIPEGQHHLVDAVLGQMLENALDHRTPSDGEHLLGSGQGEGAQAGTLPAHQDHCPHYFFTVVEVGGSVVAAEPGTVVGAVGDVAANLFRLVFT